MRKNLNGSLVHVFTHRERGTFVAIQCEIQSLNEVFWNALKSIYILTLRYSVGMCVFLYNLIFSFYSFSFAFLHLQSHTSTCANIWHLCWPYRQGPMLLQTSKSEKTSLSQMTAESHTSLGRGVTQGANTWLHHAKQRTLLPNWLLLGSVKLSQDSISKDAKDSCTLQNPSVQTAAES